jgi:hypothetical protein
VPLRRSLLKLQFPGWLTFALRHSRHEIPSGVAA